MQQLVIDALRSGSRQAPKVEIVNQDWGVVNAAFEQLVDQRIQEAREGVKKVDWTPKPRIEEDDGPSVEEMYKIMERFFPTVPEPDETKPTKASKKRPDRKKASSSKANKKEPDHKKASSSKASKKMPNPKNDQASRVRRGKCKPRVRQPMSKIAIQAI